jgi:hypothetical protein
MFVCQISGRVSKPGEKPFKVVTKTRPKTYTNKVMRGEKEVIINSTGWEIVEEKMVCEKVYNRMMNESNGK